MKNILIKTISNKKINRTIEILNIILRDFSEIVIVRLLHFVEANTSI